MSQYRRAVTILVLFAVGIVLTSCDTNATSTPTPAETTAMTECASPTLTPERESASPTPAPTTTVAPAAPTVSLPIMRLGTTCPQVADLQRRLIDLGYLAREVPSQYYDVATRDAVSSFQQTAGMDPTGIADASTSEALFSQTAPMHVPQDPATSPASDAPPETSAGSALSEANSPGALAGIVIGIDPGHQEHGNSDPEPIAPGSEETKPKVSSGTAGISSGVDEYIVNLQVGLKLKALLEAQGATVYMTRETNDVDISNAQRAQLMNDAGADLVVRLHCNGDTDSSRSGAFILIPSGSHTTAIQDASRAAAEAVLPAFLAVTGAQDLGLSERSDQTGFNWSTVPVINIEMGHMSNPQEDQLLVSGAYQDLCAQGILEGLIAYFG